MTWPNVPASIAAVVSNKLATLRELQTVYGVEDLYKFLEIAAVNAHNARVANKLAQDAQGK